MKIAVRTDYMEINIRNPLVREIKNLELAFSNKEEFFEINLEDLIEKLKQLKLRVRAVHAPAFSISNHEEFISGIKEAVWFCSRVKCDRIVIQPTPAKSYFDSIDFLRDEITPILERNNIFLAWENVLGKKNFVNSIFDVLQLSKDLGSYHGVCFNFANVNMKTDMIIDILMEYRDDFLVYHLSNYRRSKRYVPLFEGDLDYNKLLVRSFFNKRSVVSLEYSNAFRDKLFYDYYEVKQWLRLR
ncbi:MAG: TIM barrel protein [Candidatus Odinarchaeota archaeon]|nr:TIM barrel protein [Candidatus Odinarchaeota archaeon]